AACPAAGRASRGVTGRCGTASTDREGDRLSRAVVCAANKWSSGGGVERMSTFRLPRLALGVVLTALAAGIALRAGAAHATAQADIYSVHNLFSDSSAVAAAGNDASLVNAWGLVASATSPWWTS